jgi:hypothetical protein
MTQNRITENTYKLHCGSDKSNHGEHLQVTLRFWHKTQSPRTFTSYTAISVLCQNRSITCKCSPWFVLCHNDSNDITYKCYPWFDYREHLQVILRFWHKSNHREHLQVILPLWHKANHGEHLQIILRFWHKTESLCQNRSVTCRCSLWFCFVSER